MVVHERHAVVVCEAHPGHGEAVAEALVAVGYEVHCCPDEESLLEAASTASPRAIVYELRHQLPVDLAILALVRRVLPRVPLLVVAGALAEPAIEALRAFDSTVFDARRVEPASLVDAVREAVRPARSRRARARRAMA